MPVTFALRPRHEREATALTVVPEAVLDEEPSCCICTSWSLGASHECAIFRASFSLMLACSRSFRRKAVGPIFSTSCPSADPQDLGTHRTAPVGGDKPQTDHMVHLVKETSGESDVVQREYFFQPENVDQAWPEFAPTGF